VRLSAPGAEPVVLADGEVGSVLARHGTDLPAGERFTVSVRPAVPTPWWIVLAGCCFLPALAGTLARRRGQRPGVPAALPV